MEKSKKFLALAGIFLVVAIALCAGYLSDYYRADTQAIEDFTNTNSAGVSFHTLADGTILAGDENAQTGFLFYPGGKVESYAYLPLMEEIAQGDVFCVLLNMPFHLAVFDVNAADGIYRQFPNVQHWYLGGHSLGGAMAASYAAKHPQKIEGLLLLGAYSTADLKGTGLSVAVVYGSEDGVMNRKKYEVCKENLPEDFQETVIPGGCHAYFGMYGPQKGDGTPSISNTRQIQQTAQAALALMGAL